MIVLPKYKGYLGAVVHANSDDGTLHGEVLGIKDVITFQGITLKELENDFRESVDYYLAWCKERGEKPERAYSGKVNLRMNPDLHAKLSFMAARKGVS